jgi:FkbM family methyltransferase
MISRRAVNRLCETAARSRGATRFALRIRNLATVVVARRLAPSIEPERNGESWFLDRLADDVSVAIDVGANVGNWAALALATCPDLTRLVCYEPSGGASEQLRRRLDGDPRVMLVSAAVSDHGGALEFYEEPGAGESSSAFARHSRPEAVRRTVEAVRLDDELGRLGIDRVDVLKIDTEGCDMGVLKGAEKALGAGRVGCVQFEYNAVWMDAGSTLSGATDFLRSLGYRTLLLTPRGLHEFDPDEIGRLLQYSNFVGVSPDMIERFSDSIHPDW